MSEQEEPETVDGITPNGIDRFTHKGFGIALAIKPDLTEEDFLKWSDGLTFPGTNAAYRIAMLKAAEAAGVIEHMTANGTASGVEYIRHRQWYGDMLRQVYNRITAVDPK